MRAGIDASRRLGMPIGDDARLTIQEFSRYIRFGAFLRATILPETPPFAANRIDPKGTLANDLEKGLARGRRHPDSLGLGQARHYHPRMSDPKRHHYLPEFYQKAWMGNDNKVTVYRRRHAGKLDIQRKARKSVGWERELYSDLSEADPELRQRVESGFFKQVDGLAYEALAEMLSTAAPPIDQLRANAWARFLMSLLHRHPARMALLRRAVELNMEETLERARQQYPSLKGENDPESFDEYISASRGRLQENVLALLLPRIVDSQKVGNALLEMTWGVGAARGTRFRFLTSDRPLMTSNGLGHRESFLVLPISPASYFIAARRRETIEAFRLSKPDAVIAGVNHAVCLQAEEFVISYDEAQTTFVDNRLGGSPFHPVVRDSQGSIFWDNPYRLDPWIT